MNIATFPWRLAGLTLLSALVVGRGANLTAAQPPITALAFTSDGALLAGSQAGLTRYQWPDLTPTRALPTRVTAIQALAFAPNQRFLAVAGGRPAESGICEIIAWPTGETLVTLEDHQDVVYCVAWSANSKSVATASMDSTVMVSSLEPASGATEDGSPEAIRQPRPLTSQHRYRLAGHSKGVLAAVFVKRDPFLLTAGIDQTIRIWQTEATDNRLVRSLENHTGAIYALAIRPAHDDTFPVVASVGQDQTIRLWQPTIGRMMRFTRLDEAIPLSVQWQNDGNRLVVACSDGHVRVIDPDTTEITADVPVQSGWCYSLAIHPKTGEVAVGGPDGIQRISLP